MPALFLPAFPHPTTTAVKYQEKILLLKCTENGELTHTVVKTINGKIVSPLECTQQEARKLVKLTIGDRKDKDLFFYDKSRDKYIRFKYDNTDPKTYHAIYPHDQDIPKKVKDFLKDNIDLFKIDD